MNLVIRGETLSDYTAIAKANTLAFGNRASEAAVVALLRQRRGFDPALSLVAELSGEVVGHALFTPNPLRLMGENVRAVSLGPIAVLPQLQGQGIGGALIEAGHQIAREQGFVLSFLVGHDTYYPRFGYKTRAFGGSSITVPVGSLPPESLEVRDPAQDDITALRNLWQREEAAVDFALDPGIDLLDWLSPNPANESKVYIRDGRIVGYSRGTVASVQQFLAADHEAARMAAESLAGEEAEIALPLHPRSASAGAFGIPDATAWQAGMAFSLAPNPFDEYYPQVEAGERPPGRVIWPVAFEL